ncbi:HupE/UreJ family protein [Tropicimonas sp. S265A]|uniref:HupE/UreJ family protein n=1 Tax=Tropicimonas sp. S265A TaxID=3415134 RepID=UPI003C79A661
MRLSAAVLVMLRVTLVALVSTVALYRAAVAHEVRPSVADVTVGPTQLEARIQLTAESLIAGIDLSQITDTNDAPEAGFYDSLRALRPDELVARFEAAWPGISEGLIAEVAGAPLDWQFEALQVSPEPDLELPRDSLLIATVALPAGDAPVTVGWVAAYGPLVVRQIAEEGGYSDYLTGGALSAPLPRTGAAELGLWDAFFGYVAIGFEHIVPKGLDHILFVLGLFFFSLALRPLLVQVTAFTVAHTVTLALAVLGIVNLSPAIVEPLIAASIVFVAVENIFGGQIGWRRTAIVFGFGLLHGLGFASVLGEIGLDPTRFVTGLIGFNIGVELGQIAVILVAFLLVGLPFGRKPWYRKAIAIPFSAAIAATGAYWAFERVVS